MNLVEYFTHKSRLQEQNVAEGKEWRCTKEEPAWHIYPAPDSATERQAAAWCLFVLQ
jgi:hypothetical protein